MLTVLLQSVLWCCLLLLAPSLHAQIPVTGDTPIAIETLSHEPYRRTFAKPLPLENAQTLYFERDGTQARLWRLDWRTDTATPSVLPGLPLDDDKLRYTAVSTSVGVWLIGPVIMVLKTDGSTVSLPSFGADEPKAVPLRDGSVFVLGKSVRNHTERLRRLVLDAQGIAVEDKGELPHYLSGQNVNYKARYGVAAVTLSDGRVFTAGGGSSDDMMRAAIVDPRSGTVQTLPDMPHKRTFAALVPLPDGRVVVAGHEHLRCYDPDVRTVDVYDPKQNAWRSLPDLPFPLCSDAYGADGPAGTVLPDGTIVLGGHLEQHLLALHPDTHTVNGYAGAWKVVGPTQRMRISGTLQALSNNEVVIAGGVHHLDFGGCCYGTPGAERVSLTAVQGEQQGFRSFGMPLQGVGVAQRNGKLLIASGRNFSFTDSGQLRYSTLVELLDLRTGLVQQLPPLPFVTGAAQVAWLDDDRILVQGTFVSISKRGFTFGQSLLSHVPASSGALAVYRLSQTQWSKPFETRALEDSLLLDARGDDALFLGSNAEIWRLHIPDLAVDTLASAPTMQLGVIGRRLADGRIVIADGSMRRTRISLIDEACEDATDNPQRDCPEHFTDWGPMLPALRYQWYTPAGNNSAAQWQLSEASPDGGSATTEVLQTLIDNHGRVLRFVRPADSESKKSVADWWLMRSSEDGQSWQRLPLPQGLTTLSDNHAQVVCAQGCRLQLATDPRHPERELLFLREGVQESDYLAEKLNRDNYHKELDSGFAPSHVWWLDESASPPQWRDVLQADADAMRRQPLSLGGPLAGMRSLGWHLPQPVLWMDK